MASMDVKALFVGRVSVAKTRRCVEGAFRAGELKTSGTELDGILPPMSRFANDGGRETKKRGVIERLQVFFEKYPGLA